MQTYRPDLVVCTVGGIIAEQFAEGSLVELDNNEDAFKPYIGADGKVGRSLTLNNSALLTLKLSQQSSSNAQLSAWHEADKAGTRGPGPFRLADVSGTSLYQAEECWIVKAPSVEFANEIKSREWKIFIAQLKRADGGN